MRIHTVIALYVFVFSFFFPLTALHYAVLFLTFSLVLTAEMVNTAVERLGDAVSEEKNEKIRLAKDMAAGAVLICAVFSVCIGILFFWNIPVWLTIWHFFFDRPWLFALLVAASFLAFLYIKFGLIVTLRGIAEKMRKKQ